MDGQLSGIQTAYKSTDHLKTTLRNGQVVFGKVQSIDPIGNAVILFGNEKITAKTEAAIESGKSYWFQFIKDDGKIRLKILAPDNREEDLPSLLGVNKSLEMKAMISAVRGWNIPVSKESLVQIEPLLKEAGDLQKGLIIIRKMLIEKLPINSDTFHGLKTLFSGKTFSKLADSLIKQLPDNADESFLHMKDLLYKLSGKDHGINDWGEGTAVYRNLINIIYLLGLIELPSGKRHFPTLKNYLEELLQQEKALPKTLEKAAKELYYRIIGGKLLLRDEESYIQWTLQIPIPLRGEMRDAVFQWQGKKNEKEKLDKDNCRIVFDLNLPNLGKTLIQMSIQNQIISLTIFTENGGIQSYTDVMLNRLENNLKAAGYVLSSIKFRPLQQIPGQSPYTKLPAFTTTKRVDVKI